MDQLRISLVQMDIHWEDKEKNLQRTEELLKPLAGQTDLILLPEMFSTGFSMNAKKHAEDIYGKTLQTIKQWANTYQFAICGSILARDPGTDSFYNRAFFITPEESYYYEKRHLFRMGGEQEIFTQGDEIVVVPHKGWNVRLAICYDLRFPVWLRNKNNEYDVLLLVANWPSARKHAWLTLLKARAIENMAYVAAVNRVGKDIHGNEHSGDSVFIDYKGQIMQKTEDGKEHIITETFSLEALNRFRTKFPAWMDADDFHIK